MHLSKILLFGLLFYSASVFADAAIEGIWKHSQKPAWLEIKFHSNIGSVSVMRHDNNIKAAGLNIIKEIKLDLNQSSRWTGLMYSGAKNDYVDVILVLIDPTTLAIYEGSILAKSQEILRLTKE